MLSRPSSFSIRRLISQKKSDQSEDDGLHGAYGTQDGNRDSTDGAKSKTWPNGKRKGPIPTIDIRRSEDIHRIVVLPPLPDTPKSWTSSILSYDDDKTFSSPRSSPTPPTEKRFPRSPVRTPHRSPQRSPLLTPKQCEFPQRLRSRSLGPPSPGPLHILPHSPPSSPRTLPRTDEESPICPLDIADAWFSVPQTKEKLWAGEALSPGRMGRARGYSDDVQQLIRETDEAFRLRHSFSGTKLPSPRTPRAPITAGGPVLAKPSALPRRPSQRSNRSSTWSTKAQKKASLKIPVIATPPVSPSAIKTKKRQVKRQSGRRTRSTSAPASTPRWTLPESAKDLFNIRIFNKIEADEVLPESVLHEIRMSRATQARLAKEAKNEELKQKESEERLSNDSKASRGIIEGDDRKSTESMARTESPTSSHGDLKDRPTADEGHQESPVDVVAAYLEDEGTFPVVIAGDDQPAYLAKSKLVLTKPPPRRKHMPLPTIPEIITSGTENVFLSPTSRRKGTATDDYILLNSTPFTLTVPTFQHGPIRIAKANLPIGQLATAVDDTLDWTAFQMAIIGGAGDFFGEAMDYSRPSDAELDERDEMASWFSEFGFDGPGALVPAAEALRLYRLEAEAASRARAPAVVSPASPPPNSARTPAPVSPPTPTPEMIQVRPPNVVVTAAAENSLPQRISSLAWHVDPPPPPFPRAVASNNYMISTTGIGAGQEGVGNWLQYTQLPPQYQRGNYVPPSSFPRSVFSQQQHLQTDGPGGIPEMTMKKYPGHRISTESEKSLPQSPMQELVISRDSAGNEYVVPMGFNLGHDLGDFLRWEAEHVFGGGYYDSGPEVS